MLEMNRTVSDKKYLSVKETAYYAIPLTILAALVAGLIIGVVWIIQINSETRADKLPLQAAPINMYSDAPSVEEMICRE